MIEEKLKAVAVDMCHDNVCCSCSSAVDSPPALMVGLEDALSICKQEIEAEKSKADNLLREILAIWTRNDWGYNPTIKERVEEYLAGGQ